MKYIVFAILFLAVAINAFRLKDAETEATTTTASQSEGDKDWDNFYNEVLSLMMQGDSSATAEPASRTQTEGGVWKKISPWRYSCINACNNRNRVTRWPKDCNKVC